MVINLLFMEDFARGSSYYAYSHYYFSDFSKWVTVLVQNVYCAIYVFSVNGCFELIVPCCAIFKYV